MDINFHYFAVKTIALDAGFDEHKADRMASYSQFVDDYDLWVNYIFEEVPEYAKTLLIESSVFYTVTTGFSSLLDMARLIIKKYQKEVVLPFHFIPIKNINKFSKSAPCSEYRTAPATINGTFLIKQLIDDARKKYIDKEAPSGVNADEYNLIRIGLLMHIFADTYAHQNFSGFRGWENYSYLENVTNNFQNNKDITKDFGSDFYYNIPSIGHTNVNTAPDCSYVSWKMRLSENSNQHDKDNYTIKYSRSNTQVFCDAAKEIFSYFYLCQGKAVPEESKWESLRSKLVQGFSAETTDIEELKKHWSHITGYNYHYNKDNLWTNLLIQSNTNAMLTVREKDLLIKKEYLPEDDSDEYYSNNKLEAFEKKYKTAKDDFFYYNLIAKEVRDAVIG